MSFQTLSQLIVLVEMLLVFGWIAFEFGWFVGWLADKDQFPRFAMNFLLSIFGVNREVDQLKQMMTMNLIFTSHQVFTVKEQAA